MGATLSYLGYASNQQPFPRSHQHPSQQLGQCYGPILILANREQAVPFAADLCTRLVALEKDLQSSRAGSICKDAVIQYLLQHTISNPRFEETTVQLEAQYLGLKTAIDQLGKDNQEVKDELRKAKEAIIALSTPSVPDSKSQTRSFGNHVDSTARREVASENLIDLFSCSQGSDDAKSMEEDSSLPNELYEDESDIEETCQQITPDPNLHQSLDLDYEESSYLVRFADNGEDENNTPGLSEKSNDASTASSFSTSDPNSTATSFSSTSNGTSSPDGVHCKLFNEGLSQLKILGSEDGNMDNSSADRLSEAPTRAQDVQIPAGGIAIKPRWSVEKIFDSAREHKDAVLEYKRNAKSGKKDISYPDFFTYGIHYVPDNHEQNNYRTVAISGLSPSVTMRALLEKVRGGIVVDAKLLDTTKIAGSSTALVTFLYERSALAYKDHTQHHPIAFSNTVARISIVPTPTWPMPFNLRSGILRSSHTRCLEVHNLPRNTSLATVKQELTSSPVMKSSSLECMRLGADGTLTLRFTSIRAAVKNSGLFTNASRYRGCTIKYVPDPCAQPLESLLEEAEGRTDTFETIEEEEDDPEASDILDDGKTICDEDFGRLTKPEWTIEAESRRGRGFKDHTETCTTSDAPHDPAGQSSVSNEEPLRQETAASIASFAQPYFLPSG